MTATGFAAGAALAKKRGLETRIGSRLSLGIGFNKNRLRRKNYEAAICFNWIYVSNCAFGRHFCRCECQRGTGDFVPAAFSPAVLQKKHTEKAFALVLTAGIAFFAYFGAYQINVSPVSALDDSDATVSGTVTELPSEAYGRFYYVIETDSVMPEDGTVKSSDIPQRLKIRVSSTNAIELEAYDRLTAKVHLSKPTGSDEGLNTRNYYAAKNIYLTGFIYDYQPYTVTSGESHPFYYALKVRERMTEALRALLPPRQSGLVCGVLLGDKSGLDEAVRDNFQITGVSHMLSVSGMHMAIIGQFLLWALLYFGIPKRGAALAASVGVFCFMAVTGFVPSVVRSGVMSILYLLGIGIRKQADPINSLGFAMLVLTVPNPFAAGDTGLLLSFSATLGILLFSGRIQARLNRWTESIGVLKRLFRGLNSTIAATVSATVFTSPIVALTFGELSLVAPLSNLLMEFPADIMLLCGFLTSIFYYIPVINFLAMPFGLGAGIAANYLMECAAWLANLPMASIPVTQEVLLISLIVFAAASVVIVMIRWEGFRLRLTACTTAFLLVFTALGAGFEQEALEIGVLNTGNGSSVVLIRDQQAAVLCSGGGNGAYSRIDAYLRSRGIGRLDYLLISQVDKKTSSGASRLIEEYHPETILVSDQKLPQDKLRRALENRAGVYYFSSRNQTVLWEDLVISVLANKSESWISFTVGQEKFLICPAGGDVADLPEADRDCNFCIAGDTPENAYGLRGDYTILTMYQAEAIEAQEALSNIKIHELVTSKQGNVVISVSETGVTIDTEY